MSSPPPPQDPPESSEGLTLAKHSPDKRSAVRELSGTGEAPLGGEEKASSQSERNQNQAEVSRRKLKPNITHLANALSQQLQRA